MLFDQPLTVITPQDVMYLNTFFQTWFGVYFALAIAEVHVLVRTNNHFHLEKK